MKTTRLVLAALCAALALGANAQEKIMLWPEGRMPSRQDHQP